MAIAAILDWLNAKGTFSLGLELLRLHGSPSPTDLYLYQQGESLYTRGKLIRTLQEISARGVPREQAAENEHVPRASVAVDPVSDHEQRAFQTTLRSEPPRDIPAEALPVELQSIRRDLTTWHKEMTFLRGTMLRERDAQELRRIADAVVSLHEQIKRGWNRIEYFRSTGRVLVLAEKPAANEAELLRELRSLNVWISQRRHGVRPCSPEELDQKEQRKAIVTKLLRDAAATQ